MSSAKMVMYKEEVGGRNNERDENYGSSVNGQFTRGWSSFWTSN